MTRHNLDRILKYIIFTNLKEKFAKASQAVVPRRSGKKVFFKFSNIQRKTTVPYSHKLKYIKNQVYKNMLFVRSLSVRDISILE